MMRQGIRPYVIEARLPGDDWQVPSAIASRVEVDSILWHKERLLNVLIKQLPSRFTKVAWVDCDVIFARDDWAATTSRVLDEFPVAQLFSHGVFLDKDQQPGNWWGSKKHARYPSVAYQQGNAHPGSKHPGLAWAGRRDWLDEIGLFDRYVLGSGDVVMAYGFFSEPNHDLDQRLPPRAVAYARDWIGKARERIGGRVGCVPGTALHLWHGDLKDRKYNDRHTLLKLNSFDPDRHLRKNADGCWEWSDEAPADLIEAVTNYFRERKEDG
jgi:hypothetical protein